MKDKELGMGVKVIRGDNSFEKVCKGGDFAVSSNVVLAVNGFKVVVVVGKGVVNKAIFIEDAVEVEVVVVDLKQVGVDLQSEVTNGVHRERSGAVAASASAAASPAGRAVRTAAAAFAPSSGYPDVCRIWM